MAEIKEALQLLIELAKQKANTFLSEIQKDLLDGKLNDTTLKVPITRVIGEYKEFRVKTSETTDIVKDIKDAIVTIFDGNGNVANGIAQLNPKIMEKIENSLACVAVKSAVDISKLAFNDFLSLYGQILKKAFGDDEQEIKAS